MIIDKFYDFYSDPSISQIRKMLYAICLAVSKFRKLSYNIIRIIIIYTTHFTKLTLLYNAL